MIEEKVKLTVLGFSFNQTQSGTYGLVLAEEDGVRRIMVVVGTPEAQSIAFKLQNTSPPRPLTHDLFYSFMSALGIILEEVLIYKYENGIFFSQLIFKQEERKISIESRTSDAIGIALRSESPIYTTEDIMQKLAIVFKEGDDDVENMELVSANDATEFIDSYALLSEEELNSMLEEAIDNEDYELASVLRDEMSKRFNE